MVNLSFTCYFNKSCKHKNIPCASVTAGSLISKASLLLLIAFAYTADAKHDTISADISSTWLGDSGIFPTFTALVSGGIRFLSCLLSIRCVVATRTKKKKVALFQSAQQVN